MCEGSGTGCTYNLDDRIALGFKPQRKRIDARARPRVDEDDVQQRQSIDVPARKDALDDAPAERAAGRAPDGGHAADGEQPVLDRQVEGARVFGEVWDQEEAGDADGGADYAVGDLVLDLMGEG